MGIKNNSFEVIFMNIRKAVDLVKALYKFGVIPMTLFILGILPFSDCNIILKYVITISLVVNIIAFRELKSYLNSVAVKFDNI